MKEIKELLIEAGATEDMAAEIDQKFEDAFLKASVEEAQKEASNIIQTFEINRNVEWYDEPVSVRVDEFNEETLIDGDEKICDHKHIIIEFKYPLSRGINLIYSNKDGFTRADIYRCIHEGYTQLYAMEEDPGTINPQMLNRGFSDGPIGIWGHYISDLVIEGVTEKVPAYFTLSIGS